MLVVSSGPVASFNRVMSEGVQTTAVVTGRKVESRVETVNRKEGNRTVRVKETRNTFRLSLAWLGTDGRICRVENRSVDPAIYFALTDPPVPVGPADDDELVPRLKRLLAEGGTWCTTIHYLPGNGTYDRDTLVIEGESSQAPALVIGIIVIVGGLVGAIAAFRWRRSMST